MSDPVLQHLQENRAAILQRLMDLLRLPSVSTDPSYAEGMAAARDLWKQRLADMGFAGVRELAAGGHPAVYAEWLGAGGAPTFLVYGHYDVQPPDPLDKWLSPPFEPTLRDGRLYARGVSDDKAPSSIAVETLAAFLAVEGRLPINVKILLEGEEEVGSATLPAILDANRALFSADAVISADGARWREDLASVNVGSRGNAGFEFTVTTAVKDLHSGRYGGAVPNALHVMAALIASLHDGDGRIAVDGFYHGIPPLDAETRAALAEIPFDEAAFYAALDTAPTGEPGHSTLERLWLRPTLDVNGLWGGYSGPGAKTVIANEAHAKLTMRLVPGQDPARICETVIAHLKARCPAGAKLSFDITRGAVGPYEVPPTHPLLLAVERALEAAQGARPIRVRIGATLPMSDIMAKALGVDTVMFSFSTADEDFHAPNEFFRLASLDLGLTACVALLRELGRHHRGDYAAFRRGNA